MTAYRVRVVGFLAAAVVVGSLCVPGAVAQPGRSTSFGSCSNVGYLQVFDHRFTAPITCDFVGRFRIGGTHRLRVIKDRHADMGPTAPILARIHDLVTKFNTALVRMGRLRVRDTTILLLDTTYPRRDHAHTWHYGEGECVVAFYKTQALVSEALFLFALAHELFHCVEWSNWPAQNATYLTSPAGPSGFPSPAWWIEGAAEYFANLAVPGTHESDGFVHQFDSQSPSTSLIDMTYPAVVFFCWLAQHQGPSAIGSFIRQMATTPGRPAQLAAIRRVVPKDRWIAFVQDIVDHTITYPDGRRLPINRRDPIIRVTRSQTIPLPSEPYVVKVRAVTFAVGRSYALSAQATPADLAMRWRPTISDGSGSPTWQTMPATVSTCDRERRFFAVWGTTASHDGGRIVVRATESGTGCTLAGTWEITRDSLARHVSNLQTRPPCELRSGTIRMTLNNDRNAGGRSTGLYSAVNVTYACNDARQLSVTTVNGTARILWASLPGDILLLGFQGQGLPVGTIHTEVTFTSSGATQVEDRPLLSPIYLGPVFGGPYRLLGNRLLHIDRPPVLPPEGDYSFDFVRVGPPPRP